MPTRFMISPLHELAKSKVSPMKLEPVSQSERQAHVQSAKEIQNHRAERAKLEASKPGAGAKESSDKPAATKVKLPASPIVAKPHEQLGDFFGFDVNERVGKDEIEFFSSSN